MSRWLGLALLGGVASGAIVKLVPVMQQGDTAVGCTQGGCKYAAFRIPGFANVGNNTLIAFAEGRKFGCGDFGPPPPPGKHGWGQHDMVIRRSTDGGVIAPPACSAPNFARVRFSDWSAPARRLVALDRSHVGSAHHSAGRTQLPTMEEPGRRGQA
jgi:hypothetical protein